MISAILLLVRAHWKMVLFAALGLAALAYLAVAQWRLQRALNAAAAERQKLQTEVAALRGYQPIEPVTPGKVEAALSADAKADLAAIRKQVRETLVALHGLSKVVSDRTSTGTIIPATDTTPAYCVDPWGRIKVNMKDCTFEEHREELIETVVMRGVDGKTRLVKQTVKELDPVTKLPLPGDPPKVTSDFKYTEETKPEKVFGLTVLGGMDERLAPGVGLQFAEKWRLSVRALGFYALKDSELRGVVGVGWRPKLPLFDSKVSIGAGVGLSNRKTGIIYGAHLAVPLATIE